MLEQSCPNRPNPHLRSGGCLRKYASKSLLAIITCDLRLFKELITLFFPTDIITVIALLPDHHQIQVNYIKTKIFCALKISDTPKILNSHKY